MDNLFDVFRKHVRERMDLHSKGLIKGVPKDFVEYRENVARIAAYEEMIAIVTKLEKDLMTKEEL